MQTDTDGYSIATVQPLHPTSPPPRGKFPTKHLSGDDLPLLPVCDHSGNKKKGYPQDSGERSWVSWGNQCGVLMRCSWLPFPPLGPVFTEQPSPARQPPPPPPPPPPLSSSFAFTTYVVAVCSVKSYSHYRHSLSSPPPPSSTPLQTWL